MHDRKTSVEYNPDLTKLARKKRVAAYARVSSDKDEAFHSLSAQISYYQKIIADHPDWEFVEVFSDRGITGTKEERPGFQRMLSACREGKVDIILAKSITRFARNTIILLNTVRELKTLGVDVHFEEEHIETLSETGELMISLLAARAQEESRQASENQKWHYQKSYKKGEPVVGKCLGYRIVNHQVLVESEEAEVVRTIFSMYLDGKGIRSIAKYLWKNNIKNVNGKVSWCDTAIKTILSNEKYCGDLILQKSYTTDYVTKKRLKNCGEVQQFYIQDSHDAIISKETFEKVQAEIKRRKEKSGQTKFCRKKIFAFTDLVFCAHCGCSFRRKITHGNPLWRSRSFEVYGKDYCTCCQVPEYALIEKACSILNLGSLDGIKLTDYIEKILVQDKRELVFILKDGSAKQVHWDYRPKQQIWTPERREKARRNMIAIRARQKKGGK